MNPADRPWSDREISLLGTMTDRDLAGQIGRTVDAVESQRHKLGIAPVRPRARSWTRAEVRLLGTMPDRELAERLGCTRKHIGEVRARLGIAPFSGRNTPRHLRRKLQASRARVKRQNTPP